MEEKLLVSRKFSTTVVQDMGLNWIYKQIGSVGTGVGVATGILEKDFYKKAKHKGKEVSDIPLGIYTAMNVYGYEGGGINGWSIPKRDFMTRTFYRYMVSFTNSTVKNLNKMYRGEKAVQNLLDTNRRNTKQWMRSTVKNWSGNNSLAWTDYKIKQGMNPQPLKASMTMYNSLDSEDIKENVGVDAKVHVALLKKLEKMMTKVGENYGD